MKYALIDAQRRDYLLPDMCEMLAVSISGCRAWRRGGKRDRTRLSEPQAVALMKSIHAKARAPMARGAWVGNCRAEATASACAGSSD